MANDLTWLDATASAALVRSGQASPAELVSAAIERIRAVNPQINAVIHERFEQAERDAAAPLPDGPFRGVPIVVKDLAMPAAGEPTHWGTRALRDIGYVADHDHVLVQKLRAAGFVTVGRTNTPELGSTITTEPLSHGPSRNPWNPAHSTGGSSGGSAAAVAAAMVPVAHATDGGGSIRVPASECGLVGLKPSRGRVSQAPEVGEAWDGAVTAGAVTRTVRDAAAMLDVLSGYVAGDPNVAPVPVRPFLEEVGRDPGRLRVGVLDHPLGPGVAAHPECTAAVAEAAHLLEALGHDVEVAHPAALEDSEMSGHFVTLVAAWTAVDIERIESILGRAVTGDDIEPSNLFFAQLGRAVTAPAYIAATTYLSQFRRRMLSWWHPGDGSRGFDLLLSPVIAAPPPLLGWLSDPVEGGRRLVELMQFTAQFNVSGQPAVSLPLHLSAEGLPVGVQLVAAYGREDLLIQVAAQLELAQPWADRRPMIHA
jgi:amidase